MKRILSLLICCAAAMLLAFDAFSVLDTAGAGMNRGRNTFNTAETFPHTPVTAAENSLGFRTTAVDLSVNIRKAFQWEKPALDKEIRLLTCRGEYTVGCFTIFTLKDTGTFQLTASELQGEHASIPADAVKFLQLIPQSAK